MHILFSMLLKKKSALIGFLGAIGTVLPAFFGGSENISRPTLIYLQLWGVAYLVCGALITSFAHRGTVLTRRHVSGVATGCCITMAVIVLTTYRLPVHAVLPSVAVVVPLLIGGEESIKTRFGTVGLIPLIIIVSTLVSRPSPSIAAPQFFIPSIFTIYSVIIGAPLYSLSRI